MSERVLITGVCGFAGRHVCQHLTALADRPQIIGIDLTAPPPDNCDAFHQIDLSAPNDVDQLIDQTRPDTIIHLAGTFGQAGIQEVYRPNVFSLALLLDAARTHTPDAVIIAAGSAAEYGRVQPEQLPITEQTPCHPITPYGLSKQLATRIALYYHRTHNLRVTVVRPFQLIGKGVSTKLAPGAFAEQLEQAIAAGHPTIKVGNLQSARDFLDARDAADAIWTLCKQPAPGRIFNLCSGKPTKMADLLQMMIDQSGAHVRIEVDPARLRGQAEISAIYGSFQRLNEHCGWKPRTDLKSSIQQTLST